MKYDQNLKLSNAMLELVKAEMLNKAYDPEQGIEGTGYVGTATNAVCRQTRVIHRIPAEMGKKVDEHDQRKEFFDKNPAWATSER